MTAPPPSARQSHTSRMKTQMRRSSGFLISMASFSRENTGKIRQMYYITFTVVYMPRYQTYQRTFI
jgi:hypothetical protein